MKTPREISECVLYEFNNSWPTALPSPNGQAAAELASIVYCAVAKAIAESRKVALEEAAEVVHDEIREGDIAGDDVWTIFDCISKQLAMLAEPSALAAKEGGSK